MTPADSLSRSRAAAITPDTLVLEATLRGPDSAAMAYPRTLMFSDAGNLYVSDVERSSIFRFSDEMDWEEEITWPGVDTPYIAGLRGDTIVTFNPVGRTFDVIINGQREITIPAPYSMPEDALQYATASASALFLKVVPKDKPAYIVRMRYNGDADRQWMLKGSQWRNAGMLRLRGDSLLSLSAFYPIADVTSLSENTGINHLSLAGFDSPMLHRTRAFDAGRGRGAPLLMSSATWHGQTLYVLNMRPGWLRVDMYDSDGILRGILVDGHPVLHKAFYPMDIAVRAHGAGIQVVVAVIDPNPEVRVYAQEPAPDRAVVQPPNQDQH